MDLTHIHIEDVPYKVGLFEVGTFFFLEIPIKGHITQRHKIGDKWLKFGDHIRPHITNNLNLTGSTSSCHNLHSL